MADLPHGRLPIVRNINLTPTVNCSNDGPKVGYPSIPASARCVVEGTSVGNTNNQLAHVCDFVSEMQKNQYLKKFLKAVANQIREGIRAIMRFLGITDATGQYSWLIDKLKSIARELKRIQKEIIQPIIDFEKYVLAYITKLRAIVQWILGLPARFLALLKDCLTRLLLAIVNVFSDFFTELSGGGASSELTELVSAAKEVASEAFNTVNLAGQAVVGVVQIEASATAGLLIPVSEQDLIAANNTIISYTSTFASSNTVTESTSIQAKKGKPI
jgi:hypothetical protein